MRATHEDSDGTGYCRDCGTTIGEEHHRGCYLNGGIQCMTDVAKIIEALRFFDYEIKGDCECKRCEAARAFHRLETALPAVVDLLTDARIQLAALFPNPDNPLLANVTGITTNEADAAAIYRAFVAVKQALSLLEKKI